MKIYNKILTIFFVSIITTCSGNSISHNYPDNQDYARQNRAGKFFGKKDVTVLTETQKPLPPLENSAIWQAAVKTISAISIITIADPNSGIIVSDWHEKDNYRFKINVLVKDKNIIAENLRISVFYQKKSTNNQWLSDFDKNLNQDDQITSDKIRDEILKSANAL